MKVFVAGLSRSGKSSRSQYAADILPDIDYVSVSRLLRATGGAIPVHTIADCLANQRHAADALQSNSNTRPHQLVDGHALIETSEGPCLVPDWFFDELAPDLIVYVHDLSEEILSRRQLVASHDHAAEIAALSEIELAACERMALRLDIPLVTLKAPSLEGFVYELRQHLEHAQ